MAGPDRQRTLDLVVPLGEAQREYAPDGLAWKIENLEDPGDGTLRSVDGPCPYEPLTKRSSFGAATPHGVFHARLLGGIADVLLYRAGSVLYRHDGSSQSWKTLYTGLSDDVNPGYPDQFVVLNDKIIWTNGVDRALVIDESDMVVPLGFSRVPSAPTAFGPSRLDGGGEVGGVKSSRDAHYPNTLGYAWQGSIGTTGGLLEGQAGSILPGAWYYHQQWEGIHGNLSALSPASNSAVLATMQADPFSNAKEASAPRNPFANGKKHLGCELDDLTRQFAVECGDDPPDHAVALHIYRTSDTVNADNTPRFRTRFSFVGKVVYPDAAPDSVLQAPAIARSPVPVFRLMTTHQGALIIANTVEDPGLVMRSEPGFPGTFASHQRVYPDSGGAAVTAVTTHSGALLAFTADSVYSLEDFSQPRPLSRSVGCIAPRSIAALSDGTLVWLSRKGFYAMQQGGLPQFISGNINATVREDINRGRAHLAVAAVSPETGEYRCALAPAGSNRNKLIITFDGGGFRRQRLGHHIADICVCQDYRSLLFMASTDVSRAIMGEKTSKASTVYVMDREVSTYSPPNRKCIFQSGWLQADKMGLTPVNLRTLYVALRDTETSNATVTFYKNGSWNPVRDAQSLRLMGLDEGTDIVTDSVGSAVVGSSKAHSPRRFWRKVPVDLQDAYTWAFKIECSHPVRMHLVAFAFDLSTATRGNPRERLPSATDV